MKLFLLGATGRIGSELLDLASRDHQITAFVRSPHKLAGRTSVRAIAGDPRDRAALAAAMAGHDAVLSTLGPSGLEGLRRSTLMTDCGESTTLAMRDAGVRRLVIVSAAVLFPEKGLRFAFFRWLLRHHVRDLEGMERAVRESAMEWTIARPPRLIRSSQVAHRVAIGALPPRGFSTSFRSVAAFLLDAVERGEHVREIVGLAQ